VCVPLPPAQGCLRRAAYAGLPVDVVSRLTIAACSARLRVSSNQGTAGGWLRGGETRSEPAASPSDARRDSTVTRQSRRFKCPKV